MSPVNAAWHEKNRMPRNASLEQRVQWHLQHADACACRMFPGSVVRELEARGIAIPEPPVSVPPKRAARPRPSKARAETREAAVRRKTGTSSSREGATGRGGGSSGRRAASIDAFLASLGAEQRAALGRLRATIRAAAPDAEECISYGVPAFRLEGKLLVAFGAGAKHCSFYPGSVLAALTDELEGYDTSKGTIRFQPDDPLPASLVRKVVKARIAQMRARKRRTRDDGSSRG
jgi:uncharacterized protein YdhG (YjbR/CyaY superfamily)